jgi:hypothetical protein
VGRDARGGWGGASRHTVPGQRAAMGGVRVRRIRGEGGGCSSALRAAAARARLAEPALARGPRRAGGGAAARRLRGLRAGGREADLMGFAGPGRAGPREAWRLRARRACRPAEGPRRAEPLGANSAPAARRGLRGPPRPTPGPRAGATVGGRPAIADGELDTASAMPVAKAAAVGWDATVPRALGGWPVPSAVTRCVFPERPRARRSGGGATVRRCTGGCGGGPAGPGSLVLSRPGRDRIPGRQPKWLECGARARRVVADR